LNVKQVKGMQSENTFHDIDSKEKRKKPIIVEQQITTISNK